METDASEKAAAAALRVCTDPVTTGYIRLNGLLFAKLIFDQTLVWHRDHHQEQRISIWNLIKSTGKQKHILDVSSNPLQPRHLKHMLKSNSYLLV